MDPQLFAAIGLGSAVLALAGVVAILALVRSLQADAREPEQRAAAAQLDLERDLRLRSEALAAERLQLLQEAQHRIVARARAGQDDADAARALDEAVLGAPPGDELAAVEQLLRADAAARARRAAAAGAPDAPAPAGDGRAAGPVVGPGAGEHARA